MEKFPGNNNSEDVRWFENDGRNSDYHGGFANEETVSNDKPERESNNRESLLNDVKEKFKYPKFKAAARKFMNYALVAIAAVSLGFTVGTKKAGTTEVPQINISIENTNNNDFSPSIEISDNDDIKYNYSPAPENPSPENNTPAPEVSESDFETPTPEVPEIPDIKTPTPEAPIFPDDNGPKPGETPELTPTHKPSTIGMVTPTPQDTPSSWSPVTDRPSETPTSSPIPNDTPLPKPEPAPDDTPTPEPSPNGPFNPVVPEGKTMERPFMNEPVAVDMETRAAEMAVERPHTGEPVAVDMETREAETAAFEKAALEAAERPHTGEPVAVDMETLAADMFAEGSTEFPQ